jgi:L-ascorbate metabolism protein UlaG (beta-lactamase superfamily)
MIISYLGGESVRLQYGDVVLALNPVSKNSKLKPSKYGSDIVLVSADHIDFNGVEAVTFGDKKPFLIEGPGEYELKGVVIRGFAAETKYGGEKKTNTIFHISLEGISILYLGALSGELPKSVSEAVEDVDILFVPIGGDGVLDAEKGSAVAVSLEPKIIIPIHCGAGADSKALTAFLKENGQTDATRVDKLTVKKKDLDGKEGEIIVVKESV